MSSLSEVVNELKQIRQLLERQPPTRKFYLKGLTRKQREMKSYIDRNVSSTQISRICDVELKEVKKFRKELEQ